eukprot:TRINITY_DN4482_c0_g2_i1.p1 TRINITY_DN4482_c0_g2~~TRINITY_DN4482_c0_g2_i1.p1  ORF type:complete len:1140 (-),score=259.60 TRINITY_DN4482_c0_g2_i1:49-3468(-)
MAAEPVRRKVDANDPAGSNTSASLQDPVPIPVSAKVVPQGVAVPAPTLRTPQLQSQAQQQQQHQTPAAMLPQSQKWVQAGKSEVRAQTVCSCGNVFLEDSNFCRRCGQPREQAVHVAGVSSPANLLPVAALSPLSLGSTTGTADSRYLLSATPSTPGMSLSQQLFPATPPSVCGSQAPLLQLPGGASAMPSVFALPLSAAAPRVDAVEFQQRPRSLSWSRCTAAAVDPMTPPRRKGVARSISPVVTTAQKSGEAPSFSMNSLEPTLDRMVSERMDGIKAFATRLVDERLQHIEKAFNTWDVTLKGVQNDMLTHMRQPKMSDEMARMLQDEAAVAVRGLKAEIIPAMQELHEKHRQELSAAVCANDPRSLDVKTSKSADRERALTNTIKSLSDALQQLQAKYEELFKSVSSFENDERRASFEERLLSLEQWATDASEKHSMWGSAQTRLAALVREHDTRALQNADLEKRLEELRRHVDASDVKQAGLAAAQAELIALQEERGVQISAWHSRLVQVERLTSELRVDPQPARAEEVANGADCRRAEDTLLVRMSCLQREQDAHGARHDALLVRVEELDDVQKRAAEQHSMYSSFELRILELERLLVERASEQDGVQASIRRLEDKVACLPSERSDMCNRMASLERRQIELQTYMRPDSFREDMDSHCATLSSRLHDLHNKHRDEMMLRVAAVQEQIARLEPAIQEDIKAMRATHVADSQSTLLKLDDSGRAFTRTAKGLSEAFQNLQDRCDDVVARVAKIESAANNDRTSLDGRVDALEQWASDASEKQTVWEDAQRTIAALVRDLEDNTSRRTSLHRIVEELIHRQDQSEAKCLKLEAKHIELGAQYEELGAQSQHWQDRVVRVERAREDAVPQRCLDTALEERLEKMCRAAAARHAMADSARSKLDVLCEQQDAHAASHAAVVDRLDQMQGLLDASMKQHDKWTGVHAKLHSTHSKVLELERQHDDRCAKQATLQQRLGGLEDQLQQSRPRVSFRDEVELDLELDGRLSNLDRLCDRVEYIERMLVYVRVFMDSALRDSTLWPTEYAANVQGSSGAAFGADASCQGSSTRSSAAAMQLPGGLLPTWAALRSEASEEVSARDAADFFSVLQEMRARVAHLEQHVSGRGAGSCDRERPFSRA